MNNHTTKSLKEETQFKLIQDISGAIIGILLIIFAIFLTEAILNTSLSVWGQEVLSLFIFMLLIIITGLAVGLASYRTHGLYVSCILTPIFSLGYFIVMMAYLADFQYLQPNHVLYLIRIPLGGTCLFLSTLLGVFIKFKIQKGKHFAFTF
ncbi:MAG: hypothetical protein U9O98_07870 [Asgard group archaeon]|nr:hypothetical protein [Asgard group archaeon]